MAKKKNRTQYAQRIFELRKEHRMSQKELAERIGLSENGFIKSLREETFQIKYLEQIAQIFSVPVTYFFTDPANDELNIMSINDLLKEYPNVVNSKDLINDPKMEYSDSEKESVYKQIYLYHMHNEVNALKKSIRRIEDELKMLGE